MDDVRPHDKVWQYALVWTPGPHHSSFQLWAASRAGTRALWDSWETAAFPEVPTLPGVLYQLYVGCCEVQERHAHLG